VSLADIARSIFPLVPVMALPCCVNLEWSAFARRGARPIQRFVGAAPRDPRLRQGAFFDAGLHDPRGRAADSKLRISLPENVDRRIAQTV
jgi:hypothetical protein